MLAGHDIAMADGISITVGPGEFIDRLTILRLKRDNARSPHDRDRLERQVEACEDLRRQMQNKPDLAMLERALETINRELWCAEDAVRRLSRDDSAGPALAQVARGIAAMNDERARLKTQIDGLFGWQATETKIYGCDA